MWQRQQLVALTDAGWRQVASRAWDAEARDCIAYWRRHRLPLVVTRQRQSADIALGLPAPLRFGRRRLAIDAPRDVLRHAGTFPSLREIDRLVDPATRADRHALEADLTRQGCATQVYGSHGWQALTGLPYLHAGSDIDLLLPVDDAVQADVICDALAAARFDSPRLDGELLFADGAGIAWREWQRWRSGRASSVLVKRLHGAALESDLGRWSLAAC